MTRQPAHAALAGPRAKADRGTACSGWGHEAADRVEDGSELSVVFFLERIQLAGERFDCVNLDPPAFAKNRAAVEAAMRGYKEINLRALKLLQAGGHLVTCSCSYHVSEPSFLDVISEASADAHATVALVEKRLQARDHPVLITVPETSYLKCLVLRKL